jgi:hypothetical protein
MMVGRRSPLILVALCFALVACSSAGSTGTNPPGGVPSQAPAAGGGSATIPCDRLAPTVVSVTGWMIATTEAQTTSCSFNLNTAGDSSASGFVGIVSIRMESGALSSWDALVKALIPDTNGVDVPGVGDRARITNDGSLMYAVHNGHIWAVQQVIMGTTPESDEKGVSTKLMQALFQLV